MKLKEWLAINHDIMNAGDLIIQVLDPASREVLFPQTLMKTENAKIIFGEYYICRYGIRVSSIDSKGTTGDYHALKINLQKESFIQKPKSEEVIIGGQQQILDNFKAMFNHANSWLVNSGIDDPSKATLEKIDEVTQDPEFVDVARSVLKGYAELARNNVSFSYELIEGENHFTLI